MTQHIFITGALGFLGKFFVRDLLEHEPDARLYLLVRGKRDQSPQDRIQAEGLAHDRIIPVPGDITDDDLTDHAATLPPMDEFWHIAGLTAFNESRRPQLFAVNVEGTRNALALAERLQTKRFFHISTAYVAGICDGPVMEDELLPNPVFRNPYEETKYEGEKLVRASSLPWIIIRPSTIMGHSETGQVDSDKMVYGVVKTYRTIAKWVNRDYRDRGGIPQSLQFFTCGNPAASINLVCVDDCVRLMLMVRQQAKPQITYHACSETSVDIGCMHDVAFELLNIDYVKLDPTYGEHSGDAKQRFINRGVRIYKPYMLNFDPAFDRRNAQALNGWKPRDVDRTLIRLLFEKYIERLNGVDSCTPLKDTSLDLSRLPDLKEYGNFTIAYETMSRQVEAFRVPGVHGYVAYAVAENTAMVVGDPVSDQPEPLLRAFLEWAAGQNLNPCALQVHERTAIVLRELGLAVNKMGIETYLDLQRYDPELKGTQYKKFRNSLNHAQRLGMEVLERQIESVDVEHVIELSQSWLSRKKNNGELRLLLRPISLTSEPGVRHCFLRLDGRLLGFTFFTPMYAGGKIRGYTADIERYDLKHSDIPRRFNAMCYITLVFAEAAKRDGAERIALGMSPLYDVGNAKMNDNSYLTDLMTRLYEESELYAFKGIALHKSQFPSRSEEPIYLGMLPDVTEESILVTFKTIGFLDE